MCKLNNLKDVEFTVYRIVDENYVGVTHNLHKRLLKHKSRNRFNVNNIEILHKTIDLNDALSSELFYQNKYGCDKGVRNQEGSKNPYAKKALHLSTGIYFDTIKDACDALGYNYSSVRHYIKNENNKYNLIRID